MDQIPSEVVYIAGLVVVGGGVMLLFRWLGSPKGIVAEARPGPGEPFELRATPDDARSYRAHLRFDIHYDGAHEGDYGLICDIACRVADQPAFRGKVGVGDRLPEGVREIRWQSNAHEDDSNLEATVELCATGPRERGSEIVITGSITSVENTGIRTLRVMLAR